MRLGWGALAAVLLGVFLSIPVQAAVLECDSCGSCNVQIAAAAAGDIIRLNSSLSGVSLTCIQFGGKDNITFECSGNSIGGAGSGSGIWLNDSDGGSFNNTIKNCVIAGFYYGVQISSSSGNLFYNNHFNNSFNFDSSNSQNRWNTTLAPGTNIIGGSYIAGNHWANPSGSGFSQTCADSDINGICDSAYVLDSNNTDYLALTRDTTPPSITFVPPTPANATNVTGNYIEVNVSLSEAGTCLLDWYNGTWTNVSMNAAGVSCSRNMTGLVNYTYRFRVYANDSVGNLNLSGTRQNGVSYSQPDITPPSLSFVTPPNNTQVNQSWVFINVSASEALSSCILSWNLSNQTLPPSGSSCSINKTSLTQGTYSFMMYASDLSGNWNSTETRQVTVNLSLPYVSDYISIYYGISPVIVKTDTNTTISVNVATNGTLDSIVVGITVPGSPGVSLAFSANASFNYTPTLTGVYSLTIFANTTGGYNQSVSGNFTAVDCMENETMECGIGIGECRKGNLTCSSGLWSTDCAGSVWPQTETCNQKDDNCNGIIDDVGGGTSIQSSQCQCYNGGSPMVSESCNGIDDNCNGLIDDNSDCCTDSQTRSCGIDIGACEFGVSTCMGGVWGPCIGGIGAVPELCGNGVDDNCDGQTDEGCAVCMDTDADGYGSPASNSCMHPQLDCNDADKDVNPGMLEMCDGKDNNCNSQIDETLDCTSCANGVMDGAETGVDCGGDCNPCPDSTTFWISVSAAGAVMLGVLLFLYFRLKRQGRELTWEELFKKWTPAPP